MKIRDDYPVEKLASILANVIAVRDGVDESRKQNYDEDIKKLRSILLRRGLAGEKVSPVLLGLCPNVACESINSCTNLVCIRKRVGQVIGGEFNAK